jgi:hypothetical protein
MCGAGARCSVQTQAKAKVNLFEVAEGGRGVRGEPHAVENENVMAADAGRDR